MAEGCAGCSLLGLFDLAVPACSTGSHPSGSQAVLQEDCLWGGTAVPGITALWEWKQGHLQNEPKLEGCPAARFGPSETPLFTAKVTDDIFCSIY